MANKECEVCGHEALRQDGSAPARCGFCGAPQLRKPLVVGLCRVALAKWGAFLLGLCGMAWLVR